MSGKVLQFENVHKQYRLGVVGTGTLSHDLHRWWCRMRGKEDPYTKVGVLNDRQSGVDAEYVWALQDISFSVNQGEVLGIIGKNGAGKSTLLKLLSKVTGPTLGVIRSRGRIGSLLEVGTGFHPELTGRENVYLNGAILGMRHYEITQKFDEILEFSGIGSYIDTPVKRYSSGMYVRLAFAVAAHLEPEILVVDEVLAVGDAEFQKRCLGKMGDVARHGRTILFVSHNMGAVLKLCSRGLLLDRGRAVMDGDVNDVVARYGEMTQMQAASGSLEDVEHRSGSGALRFTSIEVLGEKGQPVENVHTGQSISFRLGYRAEKPVRHVNIFMGLFDPLDVCVTGMNNEMAEGTLYPELHGEGFITCTMPQLGVMPGQYRVALNAKVSGDVADVIQSAATLSVENGDFFGSGKIFPNPIVKTIMPQSWVLDAGV